MSSSFLCLIHVGFLFAIIQSQDLTDDFWGVTHVTVDGQTVHHSNSGYASVKWNVNHSSDSKFPIGSNTKLFTTVSIYQLQEQGLLNVTDPVSKYLNQSDFVKFGFPNVSSWCPILYNDFSRTCQNITFINLLSMSSGMIMALNCEYNETSPFKKYCWEQCVFSYLPYSGSIANYVSTFIMSPLTFLPGNKYEYNNMNFILCGYIIEKLSGINYETYIQKNIFDVMNLTNTYYDPWDGQFSVNNNRVSEFFLYQNVKENNNIENIETGNCAPYLGLGAVNAAGGAVSNNMDMNKWYNLMFSPNILIPKVFKTKESREYILYPWSHVKDDIYYSQGLTVNYEVLPNNISNAWPDQIWYIGGTLCSHTAIHMIPKENNLVVVSAFTNAIHVYVPNGIQEYNQLKYNTSLSICQMRIDKLVTSDFGGADAVALDLLHKYSNQTE
eukprot:417160_1